MSPQRKQRALANRDPVEPKSVGLVGLGRMGRAIAGRLASAELLGAVYNRTVETSQEIAAEIGVRACSSLEELTADSSILITTVSDATAISAVFDESEGLPAFLRPGTLCLEMSTVGPATITVLGRTLSAVGCALIDAPVSGSTALAARGELTILAGGDATDIERAQPIFDAIGRRTFHMGPLGAGATMKLAVNNVIYGLNQSVAESLVLAERAGISRDLAYDVFANSAVAAPFLAYRRALFENPDLAPLMSLDLALKDLALILELASEVGAQLPQATANSSVMEAARARGLGSRDVSVTAEYLRTLSEGSHEQAL
jgi:3-hydroxyisobutyrate dehydrogenase-like beta-hydroxyacid dehydrogenase